MEGDGRVSLPIRRRAAVPPGHPAAPRLPAALPLRCHRSDPHTQDDYRHLFTVNTPRATYTARVTSVTHFDVRDQLGRVDVPTLLLTPEDDKLVGTQAAQQMLAGIPDATEIVLPHTGHMFRFTHPDQYGQAITAFIDQRVSTRTATT